MDEEFLKKFIGKAVEFRLVGEADDWVGQTLMSVGDGIATFSNNSYVNYVDVDIISVLSEKEA